MVGPCHSRHCFVTAALTGVWVSPDLITEEVFPRPPFCILHLSIYLRHINGLCPFIWLVLYLIPGSSLLPASLPPLNRLRLICLAIPFCTAVVSLHVRPLILDCVFKRMIRRGVMCPLINLSAKSRTDWCTAPPSSPFGCVPDASIYYPLRENSRAWGRQKWAKAPSGYNK